ncbi:unnamed protein product [Mucor fragilis]
MAPLESILWIISFVWVFYQLFRTGAFDNQVIAGWMASILLGILWVRFSSKQKSKNEDSATSSDEQWDIHDAAHQQSKKSDGNAFQKSSLPTTHTRGLNEFPESINRIFGASKTSFRANADDGLLCGVLLLPMVAATKLVDATSKNADRFQIAYLQVRMELVLFMSVILLLLVLTNDYSHPVKRVIRKRGLFVSSICVAALCTTLLTQFTPLAPVLTETPVAMTVLSVTMFQWFLYICVVTLKKCFTLGEMCVISQAAAVVVYGASEYICSAYYPDTTPMYLHYSDISTNMVLIHALVVGMIFIGVVTYPLLRYSRRLAQRPYWRSLPSHNPSIFQNRKMLVAVTFYMLTATIVLFVIAPICQSVTGEHPFMWTLDFLYMSPSRMFLCLYWSLTVITTVVIWVLVLDFVPQSTATNHGDLYSNNGEGKALTSALNKKRKLFHALAVIMFVPGVLFEVTWGGRCWTCCIACTHFLTLQHTEIIPAIGLWCCVVWFHLFGISTLFCSMALGKEFACVFDRVH